MSNSTDMKFKMRSSEINLTEIRVVDEENSLLVRDNSYSYWEASVVDGTTTGPTVTMGREGDTAKEAFTNLAEALLEQNIEVI